MTPRRVALLLLLWGGRATAQEPYRDARRPVDERVQDLLARMTLEEKFWQLYMSPGDLADSALLVHGVFGLQVSDPPGVAPRQAAREHAERINAIQRRLVEGTRLGIPMLAFDEALHGLMRAGATTFPQAIGLAATWDTALVRRVAAVIAAETRSRGVRQVLSPVVNVANDVRWGRVEETYGEDPVLASAFARAFVEPFERAGIVTTPKHFVANVGDGGRDSWPIELSARRLEEYFFPPFRAAIDAGARSLMTAYNSVDGVPATQSRALLTDVLRTRWGFTGFTISDAAATGGATVLHLTEPNTPVAAQHAWEAGLDVVFQSTVPQHRPYWEAVRRGLVADSVLDRAVARVLRAKVALGLFERPYADPDSAALLGGAPAHRALAREAAAASLVLLRNARQRLPLAAPPRTIAVIGADAVDARLGGYSGPGIQVTSILEGLRRRAGAATRVLYAAGPGRDSARVVTVPATALSLRATYWDNPRLEGPASLERGEETIDARWTFNAPARFLGTEWYSVRWEGVLSAPAGGALRLGVEGVDGYRLWLGDRLLLDRWHKQSAGLRLARVVLPPGSTHRLRLEYFETTGNARVRLVWDAGVPDRRRALDSAVAVARRSALAVVVVGLEEGEFRDRSSLGLPGHQEALIRAVAATGRPVVVIVVGGSAVTMPWLDLVDAVLLAWYPGEAGGEAVADALFGDVNPAGRLPISFPVAEGQLPAPYWRKPTGRGDDYLDLSYRPLFPFGFGLSYTTFAYDSLTITPATISPGGTATVRAVVRNSGTRAGDEVVQLYLRDVLASRARPTLALQGFARVRLAPGETRAVSFVVGPRELALLDDALRPVVEPGQVRAFVGASSTDLRLRGTLTIAAP